MASLPPLPLLLLWAAWLIQAALAALQVRKFARRCAAPPRGWRTDWQPRATVIVPFKGVDPDLPAGIRGLCTQDYPDYRLWLVVDSPDDPAHAVLQRELARYPQREARILIAGPAAPDEGQKVHNQRFALAQLDPESAGEDAWVFADSDAVPGPRWLADLIAPLCQKSRTALTTGYRWLVPEGDGPQHIGHQESEIRDPPAFWSRLASVMNSSVACFLGRESFNHAWGGSMALLAGTAREGRLTDRLRGALTDDYQFTRLCRELGRRVYFVPQCLVATPVRFDLPSLWNFGHRQYLITRVYAPWLFVGALALTTLYVAGWASLWAALLHYLYWDPRGGAWLVPLAVLAAGALADQVRAGFRAQAIRAGLGAETLARLRPTLRCDRWLTPAWMLLHWLLVLRAAVGRTMRWRGLTYRLYAPQHVERV